MRQRVKIVIKEEIVRELYAIAGEDAVQTAEPMKNHTTFRVGGPADYSSLLIQKKKLEKSWLSAKKKRSRGSSPETAVISL